MEVSADGGAVNEEKKKQEREKKGVGRPFGEVAGWPGLTFCLAR